MRTCAVVSTCTPRACSPAENRPEPGQIGTGFRELSAGVAEKSVAARSLPSTQARSHGQQQLDRVGDVHLVDVVVVALDAETGKTLWQFKTGSSLNSTAITYTHKGQQYVSIASGLGGSVARRLAVDKVPTGGSVWTFALMPQ